MPRPPEGSRGDEVIRIDRADAMALVGLGIGFGVTAMSAATDSGPQPFMLLLSCLIAGVIVGVLRKVK